MWVTRNSLAGLGVVYAGTDPSAVIRSDTGGDNWVELTGLRAPPSTDTWSFPPRPHTHHVRWIEADASVADRVFVAIEAGALVRTFDGGGFGVIVSALLALSQFRSLRGLTPEVAIVASKSQSDDSAACEI